MDGRLNIHSHGKGHGRLTSHSHAAGLINRGPFVPQQSTRWTVQDNCVRTITVSSVCLNVYGLFGDETVDERGGGGEGEGKGCFCSLAFVPRRVSTICVRARVNGLDKRFLELHPRVSCQRLYPRLSAGWRALGAGVKA